MLKRKGKSAERWKESLVPVRKRHIQQVVACLLAAGDHGLLTLTNPEEQLKRRESAVEQQKATGSWKLKLTTHGGRTASCSVDEQAKCKSASDAIKI